MNIMVYDNIVFIININQTQQWCYIFYNFCTSKYYQKIIISKKVCTSLPNASQWYQVILIQHLYSIKQFWNLEYEQIWLNSVGYRWQSCRKFKKLLQYKKSQDTFSTINKLCECNTNRPFKCSDCCIIIAFYPC